MRTVKLALLRKGLPYLVHHVGVAHDHGVARGNTHVEVLNRLVELVFLEEVGEADDCQYG